MTKSIRVIPAILTDNPQTLKKMLQQSAMFTDYVQIDIMDGDFVPSRSITWEQIDGISEKTSWEAHLMVKQPERQFESYKKAGADKVVFHYEATSAPKRVIFAARGLGLKVGLAVNPETPISNILPLVGDVDSVLFLSVHPGFYGAQFIPEVLDKIAEIRQRWPDLVTGIDGGIKESNIVRVTQSGVNEIFVGSAIFLQPRPGDSYRKLLALAQNQP